MIYIMNNKIIFNTLEKGDFNMDAFNKITF